MLQPAQLYKNELDAAMVKTWYDMAYIYFHCGEGGSLYELPDNNKDSHHFVSIDKSGNLLGYVCYSVVWMCKSAVSLGLISFDRGNIAFLRDAFQAVKDIFEKYRLNRLVAISIADNPALPSYRRFISKHGGRQCSYERQAALLMDNRLHDLVGFEIMASEWIA